MHFSAFQPHRQDLPIRFGQRLQKLFYVNLCGDIVLELRVLVGMEQPGFRTVNDLMNAQHLARERRRVLRPRVIPFLDKICLLPAVPPFIEVFKARVLLYIVEPSRISIPLHDARNGDRQELIDSLIRHKSERRCREPFRCLEPLRKGVKKSEIVQLTNPQRCCMGDTPAWIIAGIILQPTFQSHVRPRHIGVGVDDAFQKEVAFDLPNDRPVTEQRGTCSRQLIQRFSAALQQLLRDHQKRRNQPRVPILRAAPVLSFDLDRHFDTSTRTILFHRITSINLYLYDKEDVKVINRGIYKHISSLSAKRSGRQWIFSLFVVSKCMRKISLPYMQYVCHEYKNGFRLEKTVEIPYNKFGVLYGA